MSEETFKVRLAKEEDLNFILATWLNHYKDFSYFAKRIRRSVFFTFHHAIAERLIRKSQILIAYPDEDEDIIFGFLVYERGADPIVHFAFVKQELRRMGIATLMFKRAAIDPDKCVFTHWTMTTNALTVRWPNAEYNPYLI